MSVYVAYKKQDFKNDLDDPFNETEVVDIFSEAKEKYVSVVYKISPVAKKMKGLSASSIKTSNTTLNNLLGTN